MRAFVVRAAIVVLAATSAAAQAIPSVGPVTRGRLVGVYDDQTGEPLEGVQVRDVVTGLSALTTATGTLSLFFVDTTGGVLSIRKLGFDAITLAVSNSPRDTVPLTIVLKRSAQVLPTVVTKAKGDERVPYVSPGLQAFEERRHAGFGYFIPETVLRKRDNSPLSEVIIGNAPGLLIRGGRIYGHRIGGNKLGNDPTPCWLTVYINGALYYSKANVGMTPPDFSTFPTSEYAGIEFYPGGATLPVQYNRTDSGCGTLLLWTRER